MKLQESSNLVEWRNPNCAVRILVQYWYEVVYLSDQYIERPKSIRFVWQYLKRLGLTAVFRKIRSRLAESARNRKVAAIGTGWVQEAPHNSYLATADQVVFFAPNHSQGLRQVVVDKRFVVLSQELITKSHAANYLNSVPIEIEPYVGWTPYSGVPVDAENVRQGLSAIATKIFSGESFASPDSMLYKKTVAADRKERSGRDNSRPTAVLFGLGNYAKINIIPFARRFLNLRCIHEIDPDQLKTVERWKVTMDTMPAPRAYEHYDVWFIAGYHHTHSGLAIRALRDGAYAVTEKPIATTWADYEELCRAVEETSPRRFFACFHKRYSRFNDWALVDLGMSPGDPVDMHCIVYEIPLPRLHWYNWPNSGSRLVSNGCHWLDFFLFINKYCSVVESRLWLGRGSDLAVFVRLENKATMVMSLTDTGSERLGVRDLIELRAPNVTVRMIDGKFYEAENSSGILHQRRINPYHTYRRMYKKICKQIISGDSGDSLKSLVSTKLMLELEDKLRQQKFDSSQPASNWC